MAERTLAATIDAAHRDWHDRRLMLRQADRFSRWLLQRLAEEGYAVTAHLEAGIVVTEQMRRRVAELHQEPELPPDPTGVDSIERYEGGDH